MTNPSLLTHASRVSHSSQLTLSELTHIILVIKYINARNGISRMTIATREVRSPAESLAIVRSHLNCTQEQAC